jgi:hypothetical protein
MFSPGFLTIQQSTSPVVALELAPAESCRNSRLIDPPCFKTSEPCDLQHRCRIRTVMPPSCERSGLIGLRAAILTFKQLFDGLGAKGPIGCRDLATGKTSLSGENVTPQSYFGVRARRRITIDQNAVGFRKLVGHLIVMRSPCPISIRQQVGCLLG